MPNLKLRPNVLIRLAGAAVLAALATPAVASAADYCVLPATGCPAPNTFPASAAGVQAALDAAAATAAPDRVFLGAMTYTSPAANGFSYNNPGSPVELIGQGPGSTALTAAPARTSHCTSRPVRTGSSAT